MSAGSLLGAMYQARQQEKINKRNLEYQQEANRLSIDLANTAHQREVDDLRAAGLNPILSAGGSGAQTPSIGAVQAENPYNGLANSASAVSREIGRLFTDQVALANEQAEAQISNTRAEKLRIESDAELKKAMADSLRDARTLVGSLNEPSEDLGDWLGNSAFQAKESLKKFYNDTVHPGLKDNSEVRFPYKGRRMTPSQIWADDPEHYSENMERIKNLHKKRK